MSDAIKAQAGDYLFIDGTVRRVVWVSDCEGQPQYLLEDGRVASNGDFGGDDVVLEAELL